MKRLIAVIAIAGFLVSACMNMDMVTVAPNPFSITPSRPPVIFTLTPIIIRPTTSASPTLSPTNTITPIQSSTATVTITPNPTLTGTPTSSPTLTNTFTPSPTATSFVQVPEIQLLGCETGIDLTHGMGEVTNAYITLTNPSRITLTSVCATLTSGDEGRIHPDKTICIPSLPGGFLVVLKLTIDTTFQVNTLVDVSVTSLERSRIETGSLACQEIGHLKPPDGILSIPQPIP